MGCGGSKPILTAAAPAPAGSGKSGSKNIAAVNQVGSDATSAPLAPLQPRNKPNANLTEFQELEVIDDGAKSKPAMPNAPKSKFKFDDDDLEEIDYTSSKHNNASVDEAEKRAKFKSVAVPGMLQTDQHHHHIPPPLAATTTETLSMEPGMQEANDSSINNMMDDLQAPPPEMMQPQYEQTQQQMHLPMHMMGGNVMNELERNEEFRDLLADDDEDEVNGGASTTDAVAFVDTSSAPTTTNNNTTAAQASSVDPNDPWSTLQSEYGKKSTGATSAVAASSYTNQVELDEDGDEAVVVLQPARSALTKRISSKTTMAAAPTNQGGGDEMGLQDWEDEPAMAVAAASDLDARIAQFEADMGLDDEGEMEIM